MSRTGSSALRVVSVQRSRPRSAPRAVEEPVINVTLQADNRLLFSVPEAAHRLGISRSRLYEIIAEGGIETVTIGRLRKVSTRALEDFVEKSTAPLRSVPRAG